MENRKVRELIEQKNKIEAEIASIEKGIRDSNYKILYEEVCNLLDCTGRYEPRDYWAPERLWSNIDGVKNIRLLDGDLIVKARNHKGFLVPEEIEVRGSKLKVKVWTSNNFEEEMNY